MLTSIKETKKKIASKITYITFLKV